MIRVPRAANFTTAIARGALNHARLTSELTTNRPEHLFASHNAVLTHNLSLSGNKTHRDSTDVEYNGKRGYRCVPDGETAASAGVLSFAYSAFACRSIGIPGSASFQVAKKSS
jgi:hypothetical protein